MSVSWVKVMVRAWHPDGRCVPDALFVDHLCPDPTPAVIVVARSRELWQTALVMVVEVDLATFADVHEPSEALAKAVRGQLERAGQWLCELPADVLGEPRRQGFVIDVHVDAWIKCDQFELDLPPEFIAGCGRHQLAVSILTND